MWTLFTLKLTIEMNWFIFWHLKITKSCLTQEIAITSLIYNSAYDSQVRLVAGPLPIPLPRDYSGLMQLENANRGPIVLGCAVPLMPERPLPNTTVPELLELVATGPTAPRVKRARLGCPSEARLLASPKMQRLLSACR